MPTIVEESSKIKGVYVTQLQSFGDDRGRFMETFRKEWFPQRTWHIIQTNCSYSQAYVLRGLHYHHHQVDYWFVSEGKLRAGLVDLRPSSPTYLHTQTVEMGQENNVGLFIPIGVAHGFVALTDVIMNYIVDNYYNGGQDEHGIAWNDPDINLNWGVTTPILSERDAANPYLKDISPNHFPDLKAN